MNETKLKWARAYQLGLSATCRLDPDLLLLYCSHQGPS